MLRISIERAALADADVLGSAYRRIIAVVANAAGLILRRCIGFPGDAGMAVNPATSGGVGVRIAFQHDVSPGYAVLVCLAGRSEHAEHALSPRPEIECS